MFLKGKALDIFMTSSVHKFGFSGASRATDAAVRAAVGGGRPIRDRSVRDRCIFLYARVRVTYDARLECASE